MLINYKMTLENVDWQEMKTTLAQDNFDNGRTPEQLRTSFANSHTICIAYAEGRIIGTARVLSDGVCNAYLVDIWTLTAFRHRGIARTMIEKLLKNLPGQHVYLQTDDDTLEFYKKLGFTPRPTGMEKVIGQWLINEP